MRSGGPGSALHHGLLVRNPAWNLWLRVEDRVLRAIARTHRSRKSEAPPRRILLGVGGHLGDAVLATCALPLIAESLPGAEVGVATGSWNAQVFRGHPSVARVHGVDHWMLNRGGGGLVHRWAASNRSWATSLSAIRAAGYDVAVDLYPYYPNSAALFHAGDVPVRVGYPTGGSASLYSSTVAWTGGQHVTRDHVALLRAIMPNIPEDVSPRYSLPPLGSDVEERGSARLRAAGLERGAYAVVHPGAGRPQKQWSEAHWVQVVAELAASGTRVVLTGAGSRQAVLTKALSAGAAGAVDLADQLGWDDLRFVVANARCVLSVDTVTMHLAGAAGVPCVALMTAIDDPERWRPLGERSMALSERVPCAPCYRRDGCAPMTCITSVTPDAVLRAVKSVTAA